jgi:hypothetical protein
MNLPETDDDQDNNDPYTLIELSNGLEALARRLDQTEDHFGGALEKVSKAVLEVRGQLAELLKKQAEKDIPPQPWADRATRAQWDELVGWVDWLQRSYGTLAEFEIYPCWPAHLGMVEELGGLFHSWKRAVITDELATTTGSSDLTAWHDRWLWPLLQRAKGGHYRTTNCKDRHVPERVIPKSTDRQYLPTKR